jgi:asparagine synthase (glutamine-hydrolysing)
MKVLVGWSDVADQPMPADAIVARMLGPPERRPRSPADLSPAAALAVEGDGRCDRADDGAIASAVVGAPRWEEPELAAVAVGNGHAAALTEAYRRYGEGLFRYLHGAFSLAIVDRASNRVVIAIDRFGIYPMCYAQLKGGGVVFGSTTDLVRRHPAVTSTVPAQAVFEYLFFCTCPSPRTIYREQAKLLPAQYVVFEPNEVRRAFYWQMPYRDRTAKDVRELSADMMRLLRRAVGRTIEDQPPKEVGAFLSGGLDSSTVVGLLREAIGAPIKTFTIGFVQDRYDEAHYATITARHFGAEPHVYYLTPKDVIDLLPVVARSFDEPYGNSSVIPAYYCARQAKEYGISLLLAGDGGDELFAGNSRYVDQTIFSYYGRIPRFLRRGLIEPVTRLPGLGSLGRKARSYISRALTPMPDRLETYNFYRSSDLADVFAADALATIDREEPLEMLREVYGRTPTHSMLQGMLHVDLKVTLADNDLRKVGTACELAELAVRYPFLDEEVAEFAAGLAPGLLLKGRKRRWFFRQAVKDFLAPETLRKRKHGFGMPFAEWIREDPALRAVAVECLQGFKRRGYLRGEFIDRLIADSVPGVADALAWDIMMIELWFRDREAGLRSARHAGFGP